MRIALPATAVAVAFALGSGVAGAQKSSSAPQPKYKPQPLILEKEQFGAESLAGVGRSRMRNGDCAGALDAFDAALRTAVDPSINRDRGMCHEQLGHAYPAIDDYRTYLTAQPDAPDAEGIRQRLVRLEQETTGRSSASSDVPENAPNAGATEGGVGASASASVGSHAGATRRDKMEYVDRDDDAESRSPYRWGKGWAFAPFFAEHKWISSGSSFGDASTWSESVGLQVRYSFGRAGALFVEAGYEHFNTTSVDAATIGGLTSQIGYEFRFPLDGEWDNEWFLAPGVGYEHLVVSPTDPEFTSATFGAIVPRVRLGYRRLVAATVAIDVFLDGGWAQSFQYGAGTGEGTTVASSALVAVGVGLGWGL